MNNDKLLYRVQGGKGNDVFFINREKVRIYLEQHPILIPPVYKTIAHALKIDRRTVKAHVLAIVGGA